MKKTLAILCVLTMLIGTLVGCTGKHGTKPSEEDVFKLGLYMPLSGPTGVYGQEAKQAVELCVKQINAAGGFNGQKVKLISYDTTSSTEEALKVATKLVQIDKVNAVIMPVMSSEIMASAGVINDAGIIAFGAATSPSWMRDEWPLIYRAAKSENDAVPANIALLQQLGYNKCCIFKGQDENSITFAKKFSDACEEANIDILLEESFDVGDNDYSAQALNITAQNPEVVVISVNGETGGVIIKQLRQAGYNGIIVSKDSMNVAQVKVGGKENCNYVSFAMPYVTYESIEDCEIPTMRRFLEEWVNEYGSLPETDSAYRGYEAARTLWEAAKISGANDTESQVKAMSKVKYEGLGGTLDFTHGRDGYKTFSKFIYIDGKNIPLTEWLTNGGYETFKTNTGRAK